MPKVDAPLWSAAWIERLIVIEKRYPSAEDLYHYALRDAGLETVSPAEHRQLQAVVELFLADPSAVEAGSLCTPMDMLTGACAEIMNAALFDQLAIETDQRSLAAAEPAALSQVRMVRLLAGDALARRGRSDARRWEFELPATTLDSLQAIAMEMRVDAGGLTAWSLSPDILWIRGFEVPELRLFWRGALTEFLRRAQCATRHSVLASPSARDHFLGKRHVVDAVAGYRSCIRRYKQKAPYTGEVYGNWSTKRYHKILNYCGSPNREQKVLENESKAVAWGFEPCNTCFAAPVRLDRPSY